MTNDDGGPLLSHFLEPPCPCRRPGLVQEVHSHSLLIPNNLPGPTRARIILHKLFDVTKAQNRISNKCKPLTNIEKNVNDLDTQ
jgi:hypothetical protein